MTTLPISRLIDVSVVLSPLAAQAQDLDTLLALGDTDVIDVVERLRTYTTLDQVSADFGTSAPEYFVAQLYFSQVPKPKQLKLGRWAQSPTSGKLVCAPLSAANQLIAAWTAIADGGFQLNVNGVGPQILNGLDFSAVTNLNGVADVLNAALAGAVVTYNAVYRRFEFESATTGDGSAISFLATAAGTDISGMLGGTAAQDDDGAYVADGIDAETALEAATIFDGQFGQTWYALMLTGADDDDHLAVAGFIEGANNKHTYWIATEESGILSTVVDTDIASLLQALDYKRSITQYSSTNPYSVASLAGRAITVDYNGQATVITLMYKQEPGISAENLTETQIDALEGKNGNVFVAYNNGTAIVEPGKVAAGFYIDEVTGTDWLAVTIMTALYNLLFTTPTKIPQTDAGVHLLVTTVEDVLSQAVLNGLVAPGTWESDGFGTLKSGDFLPKGFYVYATPVANQSAADRAARIAPPIQVAIKLAGAIHDVAVTVNVNR